MANQQANLMQLPFSQACENNQEPIRQVLSYYLQNAHALQQEKATLLEIGSGTGQHGAYITAKHTGLHWFPTDQKENLDGIRAWVQYSGNENFYDPVELDINQPAWPGDPVDFVFSANTAHIMSWPEVERMFAFLPQVLKSGGHFLLYGPFNYNGRFTSDSNAQFNEWLKAQAPHRAIRDFEKVNALAETQGLSFVKDHAMPANNRTLVWQFRL